jgi:phosphoribosylformimino-5-aminoimidazole carboxamide ribotide isomerase
MSQAHDIKKEPFHIYTAIDILNEQCVRLQKGDFDASTVYNKDPVFVAKRWKTLGAKFFHVVDLDGAKTGLRSNFEIIEKIIKETEVPVQVGGGIRKIDSMQRYLDAGAKRVVIGSIAVKEPEVLKEALDKFGPEAIVLALDCRNGFVSTEGWLEDSHLKPLEVISKFKPHGLKYMLYTDIDRDGMLQGPNIHALEELLKFVHIHCIASGGVSSIDDVKKLKELRKKDLTIDGVIIGKALYDMKINSKQLYSDEIYS